MKLEELMEGGWMSEKTQDTVITPQTVADAIPVLKQFETALNKHLAKDDLPPIKIGNPVGSGTYYKRDLKNNPDKEYGDIDVQFIIPRGKEADGKTKAAYFKSVTEFCEGNKKYETTNGRNVIFEIGKDFIQVDLVAIFGDRLDFTKALAPEHGTKGVLSGSLYSALAQALDISISDSGVQGKTVDGALVSYRKSKGTTLNLISTDHKNWAMDVAKFMGAKKIGSILKKHPGMKEEVKIKDIIDSFKGIAQTLELNGKIKSSKKLLDEIKSIYIKKIEAVASSSKFDKAKSKEMKAKAAQTQKMLRDRSKEIAQLFEGKRIMRLEELMESTFSNREEAETYAKKKERETNDHRFVVVQKGKEEIYKVVAFEIYDHWSRAMKHQWPRVLREEELAEMRQRDDGSKQDIELKIEQLADQMETAGSEGEQEEIYAEIERLSRKLDQMM